MTYRWPGNIRELENVASYYRILGAIPDNINDEHNQQLCPPSLKTTCPAPEAPGSPAVLTETEVKIVILQIMSASSKALGGIGRSTLGGKLLEQSIQIGEGKLKRLLLECQRDGFIQVNPGRSGSQITQKGLAYLQRQPIVSDGIGHQMETR